MPVAHSLLTVTLAWAAAAPLPLPAQRPAQPPVPRSAALAIRITDLLRDPAVAHAHWGIAVAALDGTPIFSLDDAKLFRPASTTKLFTTAAAMALLGPEATVTTTVLGTGTLDSDGVLHGDLVLRGAGDANLSGQRFPYVSPAPGEPQPPAADPLRVLEELTTELAAHGLKQVTGQVIADDTLWPHNPYPLGWEVGDQVWGYGAPVSALALDDNQIILTLDPATDASTGFRASIAPDVGYLSPPQQRIDIAPVSAKEPAVVSVDLGQLQNATLHVQGQLPRGVTHTEEIAVLDPALFAAAAFRDRLHARGITTGPAIPCQAAPLPPTQTFAAQSKAPLDLHHPKPHAEPPPCTGGRPAQLLASHISPSLGDDITATLKESLNLHAEMLLRRLGAAFGDDATYAQGARVVHQWLTDAGIPDTGYLLYDGSGLSGHDLVSPRAEVQLLAYAATQPWFPRWKAALPIGGVDGTLLHRFTEAPLKGHVLAKTGTLGESRALAGYVQCASGREVLFSVLVDNHLPGSSANRLVMDKIVEAIAAVN